MLQPLVQRGRLNRIRPAKRNAFALRLQCVSNTCPGMSKPNLTFRVDDTQIALAEELLPLIARDPALKASGRAISRSTVLRLALEVGLEELKRRGGVSRTGPTP